MSSSGADPEAHANAGSIRVVARGWEPDRYLAALLAPADVRDDLLALAAFSGELRHVCGRATEPAIDQIRLQWWREAIHALSTGQASGHPIGEALGRAMRRHGLPAAMLEGVIDARDFDLQGLPLADEAALADYMQRSEGGLFALALRIVGAGGTSAAEDAARVAGLAYGITLALTLASWPGGSERGGPGLFPSGPGDQAGKASHWRSVARRHLAEARERAGGLGPRALPAFLPLVMVEPYLRVLERHADPLSPAPQLTPIGRVWRIWRAHLRRRV
jgi:phytoene synthase